MSKLIIEFNSDESLLKLIQELKGTSVIQAIVPQAPPEVTEEVKSEDKSGIKGFENLDNI